MQFRQNSVCLGSSLSMRSFAIEEHGSRTLCHPGGKLHCLDIMVTSRAALRRSISRLRMASFSNSLTIHHGLFQNSKHYLSLLFSNKLSFPRRSATSPSRVAIAASRSWKICFTSNLFLFLFSASPSVCIPFHWACPQAQSSGCCKTFVTKIQSQWTCVQFTQEAPPSPWPVKTPPRKLCTSPSSRPTPLHTW